MRNGTAIWTILGLVVLAILAGVLLGKTWATDPMRQVEADAARSWALSWLPYKVALSAAAGLVGLGALGLAAAVAYRWADNRARAFYPDHNGVMPAVLLRPGETLADAGALPGPLAMDAGRPAFPTIAPADLPRLQAGVNQGAAATRMMRAWASREVGQREAAPAPAILPQLGQGAAYPPLEVLTGDEAHVYRLLEEDHGD